MIAAHADSTDAILPDRVRNAAVEDAGLCPLAILIFVSSGLSILQ